MENKDNLRWFLDIEFEFKSYFKFFFWKNLNAGWAVDTRILRRINNFYLKISDERERERASKGSHLFQLLFSWTLFSARFTAKNARSIAAIERGKSQFRLESVCRHDDSKSLFGWPQQTNQWHQPKMLHRFCGSTLCLNTNLKMPRFDVYFLLFGENLLYKS